MSPWGPQPTWEDFADEKTEALRNKVTSLSLHRSLHPVCVFLLHLSTPWFPPNVVIKQFGDPNPSSDIEAAIY